MPHYTLYLTQVIRGHFFILSALFGLELKLLLYSFLCLSLLGKYEQARMIALLCLFLLAKVDGHIARGTFTA